ncbi:lymphocyte antigen 75 isoform X2 [Kryptolebias marmoratus]|uniref:lymphocyte antigen 75 isoform X2 n=1 Tax=Kryptolebias marmoratus TaxID=37003 RepID=UPI000D52FF9D|nr:lymphocyte antigen 75 isoform X2 [Kryptolebias marmoratus]
MKLSAAALCFGLLTLLEPNVARRGTCSPAEDGGFFTIQHSGSGRCLDAGAAAAFSLAACNPNATGQLWKWGSAHRLFHVASALCLALDVQLKTLSLADCGSGRMLSWHCQGGAVYTVYDMGLTLSEGKPAVKRDAAEDWSRGGTRENICHRGYRAVHTFGGTAAGAPCEFPFRFNGSWHHECLPDPKAPGLTWCFTSQDDDRDRKWGNCLIPENGCHTLFSGPEGDSCYEFVSGAAVTWHEALDSCRSQGADLLSLSESSELNSVTLLDGLKEMPDRMWIGLHQLDVSQGWQWSDGSPLSFLRWQPGVSVSRAVCGALSSGRSYEPGSCYERLPYICEKKLNASDAAAGEPDVYKETLCAEGWVPWSSWCYKLVNVSQNFSDAQRHCNLTEGGDLAAFHSIHTKEMISTYFHAGSWITDVWIGLTGAGINPTVFKWTHPGPVTFTYWDQNQPSQPAEETSCVFYSGEAHGWRVGSCDRKLPFMCQKEGQVNESAAQTGCSWEDGWRRHGNSCFRVNTDQVFFKDRCNMTIRNRFEQAFINRLLRQHFSTEPRFFWTGLQDIKGNGQYQWTSRAGPGRVTYTNWGYGEPAQDGGCAVMSTQMPLGSWEVKNCSLFKAGTICRTDLVPLPEPEPEPELDPNATCPDGWLSTEGARYCYKVFHEERLSRKRTWEEARSFCQALGAELPSFTDIDEIETLHRISRDPISDNRYFWVGLNRRNPADPSWEWSDGRPVSLDVLHQEFHEDDAYSRDCAAFKSMRMTFDHWLFSWIHKVRVIPFFASPFHCDARLEWVCQIPRGKPPRTPVWYNPGGHHSTSIFFDGSEFWFVKEPKLSLEEAKLFCQSRDGNLASVKNAAWKILQEIKKLSDSPDQNWWIGRSDPDLMVPVRAVPWGYCFTITPDHHTSDYTACNAANSFVCEKHNITSVEKNPLDPRPEGLPCGNISVLFRNKCYTLLNARSVSFKSANEKCQTLRGTLLTISDQVEQDFVNTLLPSLKSLERIWIGQKHREWADGSSLSFQNFHPLLDGMRRPVSVNEYFQEPCVFLLNNPSSDMLGTWDYSPCGRLQDLGICQHYADKVEEPLFPKEPFTVNNHTFQLLNRNLSWFEAMSECNRRGLDLASVADGLLQSYLSVHVSRARTPMWIGLFSEDDGLHYRWTDHSHTVFSRWSEGLTGGPCVYLDTDGFWKATECKEKLGGAICHRPHEDVVPKPEDVGRKCPHAIKGPNWIPWRNNCYTFQLSRERWADFGRGPESQTCRRLRAGSEVLTIRNRQENEFIARQLQTFQSLAKFVCLGMFKDSDNVTRWFDKTVVQFSNWTNGRPVLNRSSVAFLALDGSWILTEDSAQLPAFREQAIVVCKLENEPKEEYGRSVKDLRESGSVTYEVLTERLSWFEALEACARRGGHLVSVHDEKHHEHLRSIAKTDGFPLWIGLSKQDVNGSEYEWSDGTKFEYRPKITKLLSGSSSDPHEAQCVFVSPAGDWIRTGCKTKQEGAVCYTTDISSASQRAKLKSAPVSNHCPQNQGGSSWVQHQNHCYLFDESFFNYSVYTVQRARNICAKLGAQLLTIRTEAENNFLVQHIAENPLITSQVWLDMKFDSKGEAESWQDGSSLSYSNLKTTKAESKPACAVMVAGGAAGWKTVSCENKNRVVCQTSATSSGSPVAVGLFIIVVVLLLFAVGFILYRKKKSRFTSSIRYKRTFDDTDSTSIITDAD